MTTDNEKSIEELCKPLSAKVMPASATYSISGRKMDERAALKSQRKQSSMAVKHKESKK